MDIYLSNVVVFSHHKNTSRRAGALCPRRQSPHLEKIDTQTSKSRPPPFPPARASQSAFPWEEVSTLHCRGKAEDRRVHELAIHDTLEVKTDFYTQSQC